MGSMSKRQGGFWSFIYYCHVRIRFNVNSFSSAFYIFWIMCNEIFLSIFFHLPCPRLAIQKLRVITGCGSHGAGKSKLKQMVWIYSSAMQFFMFVAWLRVIFSVSSSPIRASVHWMLTLERKRNVEEEQWNCLYLLF